MYLLNYKILVSYKIQVNKSIVLHIFIHTSAPLQNTLTEPGAVRQYPVVAVWH